MGALVKSIVAGLIGGAIGAVVWAVIAYQLHVEIGWIAWGIGALVGVAVRIAAADGVSPLTGGVAALIAAGSVAGGKYAAVSAIVDDVTAEVRAEIGNVTDEDVFIVLVDDVVAEFAAQGKPMVWPDGMTVEEATEEEHYPKEVWAEAKGRWERADEAWRNEFRTYAKGKMEHEFETAMGEVRSEGFIASFSPFDLLWFGLAVVSAYAIGAGVSGE